MRKVGALLALVVGTAASGVFAAPASAWYVDISITGAGRVYETTDANELDEHCPDSIEGFASPGTTPTGTVGATCRAGSATGDYGSGWVVRYVAEPAPGYRFAGWHSDGRTSPKPVICDGSSTSSWTGTACQFATYENLQTRARFVDDTPPSMASLSGPNQVVNGPATFTFSAVADSTLSHFECRVGGVHEWQTCSSGHQENPGTGTYTLQVRAVDWSSNRSGESTWSWTVDKVPPETTIVGGPANGSTVATTSATFEFSANESGTFVCSLNGVEVGCGSPKSYSGLANGTHTFTVRAVDVAGNADATPASRTWTVDTLPPPMPTITGGPSGTVNTASASFTFASDGASGYQCSLDAAAFADCTSPAVYSVTAGSHTFEVKARDAVGNYSTAAARTWTARLASSITVAIAKTRTAVKAAGAVSPAYAGKSVSVTLFRKKSGVFRKITAKTVKLNASSKYAASFTRPRPGTCKVTAKFAGDADHRASLKSKIFSC